ncbi:hypothetical protein [Herbidospora daliensis]|uniref:hypothetical protein n=1 Tax=Herbidospora daliensis TaxID=295585 RepID=UPI000780A4FE|nr:hypothetical protein [Herbidospora daliensis]
MRSLIPVVSAAALLLVAAPAQAAAPKDPVKAVRAMLLPGKGVTFTDVTDLVTLDDGGVAVQRRTGALMFGRGKIAASDITATWEKGPLGDSHNDGRTIRIGTVVYSSGGEFKGKLPKGKRWFKQAKNGMTGDANGWFSQVVNVAEPATLAALVKAGKRSGNNYSGTITFARLAKVSPWFKATLPIRWDKTVLTYKLTVGGNGLPQKLATSFPATGIWDSPSWEGRTFKTETRYRGWGGKVSIKAPAANQVTTKTS